MDDLAFDMYQDPEVANIIRLLDQKKQEMVQREEYEQAKNLKQAIADLQKVPPALGGEDWGPANTRMCSLFELLFWLIYYHRCLKMA